MELSKIFPIVFAAAAIFAIGAHADGQATQDIAASHLGIKLVPSHMVPVPFLAESGLPDRSPSIEFRTAEQMTQQDRLLEAGAESSIAERAGFADLEFNQGKWSYGQLVCPALPNHLFLRFMRNDGAGDTSVFSVSIPRSGEGRVRLIPIQRRGYSLFSPAPINSLTLSVFNHIRQEERAEINPGWLGTGLCYAALAGANPQSEPAAETSSKQPVATISSSVLEIPYDGGAVIRFTDFEARPHPMAWALTFNGKGTLLKVTHVPTLQLAAKMVPEGSGELKGPLLPATIDNIAGKPVAEAEAPKHSRLSQLKTLKRW